MEKLKLLVDLSGVVIVGGCTIFTVAQGLKWLLY